MLDWYDLHARTLPWRAPPNNLGNAYHVWLSEIMLQQTTVSAVIPYFKKFILTWPTIEALACADRNDVLAAWAGLGYYSRAHRLHECARFVMARYNGQLPCYESDLLQLQGFGPYTAAAVAAIAFGQKANVVDGNVERIMARVHAVETALPKAKSELRGLAAQYVPMHRCGDYAQALMDLGATICTPRQPKCGICPLYGLCKAGQKGTATDYPHRMPKAPKPVRRTLAFVLLNKKGEIYLRQRPSKGLLAGMMEVPSSPWVTSVQERSVLCNRHQPVKAAWYGVAGEVRHIFTHFTLVVEVSVAHVDGTALLELGGGVWVPLAELSHQALPSVMRRIVQWGIDGLISTPP